MTLPLDPSVPFVDLKDIAVVYGVSYATAARMAREGRIPGAIKISGGKFGHVKVNTAVWLKENGFLSESAA